ncbi:MAG: site-specific tyrosine recombinase/integron integrase [Mycoplasmatales bacterium]
MHELDLLDFYDYLLLERQMSELTIVSYKTDLNQFFSYTKKELKDLSKDDVDKYISYLKSNYKESSYLRKVASLKAFNKYLRIQNLPNSKHIDLLEAKKKEKRLPKYLSPQEINMFLNSLTDITPINSRDKAMFETLYATGMRVSEIINIKLEDVNIENKTIRVLGKGSKERVVILNNASINSLSKYIQKDRIFLQKELLDYVFLNSKGNKLTRQGFYYILKQLALNVGITDISPHKFRHSIATHMLNNGADLRMIQMILGHSNISTTEIYTHLNKDKVLEDYEKYHMYGDKKD